MNQEVKMQYDGLKDQEVLARLETSARKERALQAEVLKLLREVERRRLYADLGYGSTFEYCVKHLKYSEGAASRRINAMRLLSDLAKSQMPIQIAGGSSLEECLKDGRINLTALNQAQHYFKSERSEQPHSPAQKSEIVANLINTTAREREKFFATLSPQSLPEERLRQLTDQHRELKLVLSEELIAKLEKIRLLWSHALSDRASYADLLERMADQLLERIDPEVRSRRFEKRRESRLQKEATPVDVEGDSANIDNGPKPEADRFHSAAAKRCGDAVPAPARQALPTALRRAVLARDGYRCDYVDAHSGVRCGSRFRVEIDHIQPHSRGGVDAIENLQTLCRAHNLRKARREFGNEKVEQYSG